MTATANPQRLHLTATIAATSVADANVDANAKEGRGGREGRVFERNMTKAREMINSAAFRETPEIMDGLDPPEGHLLKRRRTVAVSATKSSRSGGGAAGGDEDGDGDRW